MDGRRCTRCGTTYPAHLVDDAFRTLNSHGRRDASKRRSLCRPCEQELRDGRKRRDRWSVKARDVIRRHTDRLGVNKGDLVTVYGWDPKRLAHDAEHQYGNGCSYCGDKYRDMGHGLADITLDVQDRSTPPYYRTNTKWCCQTCNRKKGIMTPEKFEKDRQVFEAWSRQQEQNAEDPQAGGFLFGLDDVDPDAA